MIDIKSIILEEKADSDFVAKKLNEIIKVRKCTFANDINEPKKFYICPCTNDDFFPICVACARNCHKGHKTVQLMKLDNFTCLCGKGGHFINNINETDEEINTDCFYSKFNKVAEHSGFYSIKCEEEIKHSCSACLEYCFKLNSNNEDVTFIKHNLDPNTNKCECKAHPKGNILNMNVDLEKNNFSFHFKNFNFNILDKIPITQEKYINFLFKKIEACHTSDPENFLELSTQLFSNMLVLKILELFSKSETFHHYYFVLKRSFFEDKHYSTTLIELIKRKEIINKMFLTRREIITYCQSKIYYAEYFFNIVIKNYICNNIIRINTSSYTNLNLIQRFLYLHDSKYFVKNILNESKIDLNIVFNFASGLLDFYERTIQYDEIYQIDQHKEIIFFKFNKIFKNLIKYNLINDEMRTKYFELVQYSLSIININTSLNESPYYIIKSILFSLVYYNDSIIMDELRFETNNEEKRYAFTSNRNSNVYSNIFCNIINLMKRKSHDNDQTYLKKVLKFDFYVKKIFELMICSNNNNFYIKSIENIILDTNSSNVRNIIIKSQNYQSEIRKYLYSDPIRIEALNRIYEINKDLNNICNEYFEYEILYPEFKDKTIIILSDLSNFITNYLSITSTSNISFDFDSDLIDKIDKNYNQRINFIQESMQFSTLFNSIAKLIFIYGADKEFHIKNKTLRYNSNNNIIKFNSVLIESLITFLFLCVQNNHQNLTLLIAISPKHLTLTFSDAPSTMFKFLNYLNDFLFSDTNSNYNYDNYLFYVRLVMSISQQLHLSKEAITEVKFCDDLFILGSICRLSSKLIRFANLMNNEIFELLASIKSKINEVIHNSPYYEFLLNYFKPQICNSFSEELKNSLSYFIEHYLHFINEIIQSDLYYFNLIDESDGMIYNIEYMASVIEQNFFANIFVKQNFLQNYVNLFFNFDIKNSTVHTDKIVNLLYAKYGKNTKDKDQNKFYFMDRNLSIIHLTDFELLENSDFKKDKNVPEVQTKFVKYLQELNCNKYVLMKKLQKEFIPFIQHCKEQIYNESENILKSFNFKLRIFKYYTNLIIHPLFILINHYSLLEMDLRAKESYKMYDLVYTFLEITLSLYESYLFNDLIDSKGTELIKKKFEKDGIYVSLKLSFSSVQNIKDDLILLTDIIKYFEFDKIIEIFRTNLENIITIPSSSNSLPKQNSIRNIRTYPINEYKAIHNSTRLDEKLIKVLIDYSEIFNKTLDKNLSLFRVLRNNTSEGKLDLREVILNYLEQKASDSLDYYNHRLIEDYECGDFTTLFNPDNLCEIPLKNFYIFSIYNYLFYHDSLGFQSSFNKIVTKNRVTYEKLFNYLIKRGIFTNIINECKIIYSLNFYPESNLDNNFSYEMALNCIEFLYHSMENQNQVIQEILYELNIQDNQGTSGLRIEIKDVQQQYTSNAIGSSKGIILQPTQDSFEEPLKANADVIVRTQTKVDKEAVVRKLSNKYDPATFTRKAHSKNISRADIYLPTAHNYQKSKIDPGIHKNTTILEKNKFYFLNFLFLQMRLIIKNIPLQQKTLLYHNREFKNYDKLLNIYNSIFNMLVQMIHGTKHVHFELFYKKINNLSLEESHLEYSEIYFFIAFATDVRDLVFNENILDLSILPIKTSIFVIINNLIAQHLEDDDSLIILSMYLFPMDELITVASRYLKALYIKHILGANYDTEEFQDHFEDLEFNEECLNDMKVAFRENIEFSTDDFFKIASQIYLFISILSEKYQYIKAKNIRNLAHQSILGFDKIDQKVLNKLKKLTKINLRENNFTQINKVKNMRMSMYSSFKKINTNHNSTNSIMSNTNPRISKLVQKIRNIKTKNPLNNLIITSKFFFDVVKSCEFLNDSNNDNYKLDKLKTVFFILDPRTYLISHATFKKFFDEVDRTGSNSKLKGLIDHLQVFQTEIDYKINHLKENTLKWFEISYKKIDFFSFLISCVIVVILLITLTNETFNTNSDQPYFNVVYGLAGGQILFNLIFLFVFFKSKYNYYVIFNKIKLGSKKLSFPEKFDLYVLKCFLWNEETYIMVLNILIAGLSFTSKKASFLYTVQLLGVVKFVDTIKEITIAFKLRFDQFISMVGFLGILVYFYALFGFFFMMNEFNLTLGNGNVINVCSTLLSCYMTYFNYGIRSQGGIGDLLKLHTLSEKSIFWIRYFADLIFYVTVILLVLNMINGIIISTFSAIRDENEQKSDDMNDKCFICSLPKIEFEKKKVNFKDHILNEHNYITYIKYLIGIKLKDSRDIDADQTYFINCVKNRNIKFFPIGKSISLEQDDIDWLGSSNKED